MSIIDKVSVYQDWGPEGYRFKKTGDVEPGGADGGCGVTSYVSAEDAEASRKNREKLIREVLNKATRTGGRAAYNTVTKLLSAVDDGNVDGVLAELVDKEGWGG